jgi:hypothetical protein
MRYEIRQLEVGGILDQAIKLTTDNFWLFVKIVAVLIVPVSVISGLLVIWNMPDVPAVQQPGMFVPGQHVGLPMNVLIILAVTGLINLVIVYPLTDAALIHAIACSYLDKPVTMRSSFQRGIRIFLPLVGTWFLMGLAIAAPMILGFILGVAIGPVGFLLMLPLAIFSIVLAYWYMLSTRVVVVEGTAGTAALQRSKFLVKGNFGTVFVLGLIVGIISAVIGMIPNLIPQPELRVVVTAVFQAAISFFAASAWVVFYFSCRCKAEHFDLAMLADAVAAEEPPPAMQ